MCSHYMLCWQERACPLVQQLISLDNSLANSPLIQQLKSLTAQTNRSTVEMAPADVVLICWLTVSGHDIDQGSLPVTIVWHKLKNIDLNDAGKSLQMSIVEHCTVVNLLCKITVELQKLNVFWGKGAKKCSICWGAVDLCMFFRKFLLLCW